jgi:hypothetical protein
MIIKKFNHTYQEGTTFNNFDVLEIKLLTVNSFTMSLNQRVEYHHT